MDLIDVQVAINKLVNRNRIFYRQRKTFHDAMQNDLIKLASKFSLTGQPEYRVEDPPGFIDVAWLDNQNNLMFAIEIDSSLRSKSLEKLANLPVGVERLWLCYSPKEIDVKRYEKAINGPVMKYELKFQRHKRRS